MDEIDLHDQPVVDAFLVAARTGDVDALLAVLDPDVVMYSDLAGTDRGAARVAGRALVLAALATDAWPSRAGLLVTLGSRLYAVLRFTVRGDLIRVVDAVRDPDRLAEIEASLRPA